MAEKDQEEPKTRTRSTASDKSEQTEADKSAAEQRKAEAKARADEKAAKDAELKEKREQERKERDEKREAEKAERDKAREEAKAKKEQEREEAKAKKEADKVAARQAQIDKGEIIFATFDREPVAAEDANGEWSGVTYALAEPKKEEVANRARNVIQDLIDGATEVPMSGKELADEYGGGTVQWVSFFGMLRVLGYVRPYRFRTGERGESGLSYLWIGPTDDDFVNQIAGEVNGDEQDEPEAQVEVDQEPAAA